MSRRGASGLLAAAPTLAAGAGMAVVVAIVLVQQWAPAVPRTEGADTLASELVAHRETAVASPAQAGVAPSAVAISRPAIKAMLYRAAQKYGVNPGLVLGVAWWESGWDQSQVSPTGAIGVMQIEPYTAEAAGPRLLHHPVDIHQVSANIELGAAILRDNLDRYQNDLMKALVAYYAGPSVVTDWAHLDPDAQRYVVGVHALAVAFDQGIGPA